jgi:hypothetical protein
MMQNMDDSRNCDAERQEKDRRASPGGYFITMQQRKGDSRVMKTGASTKDSRAPGAWIFADSITFLIPSLSCF